MKRVYRLPLSDHANNLLETRTQAVQNGDVVKTLWQRKQNKAFDEIRAILKLMGSNDGLCMYCSRSEGTDIEHFYPKTDYPEHAFSWRNFLWACSACNSNHKRTRFPLQHKQPLLIDPTQQNPSDHLMLSASTGRLRGRDDRGLESISVFGLERLNQAREDAFRSLTNEIMKYGDYKSQNDLHQMRKSKNFICASILCLSYLLNLAEDPKTTRVLIKNGTITDVFLKTLGDCPEIKSWLELKQGKIEPFKDLIGKHVTGSEKVHHQSMHLRFPDFKLGMREAVIMPNSQFSGVVQSVQEIIHNGNAALEVVLSNGCLIIPKATRYNGTHEHGFLCEHGRLTAVW